MSLIADASSLRNQLIREHQQAPGLFREMAQVESLLAETYRSRVLYELLQNSDDAGSHRVEVHVNEREMQWANDGRPFDSADIESLCRSASSTKIRNGASIGYRGIGLKAIAAVATGVEVESGGAKLCFDRLGASQVLGTAVEATPLLRVPASVSTSSVVPGATFTLHLKHDVDDQLILDPIALLFLRNIHTVEVSRHGCTETLRCARNDDFIELTVNDRTARFHRITSDVAEVVVPADPTAEAMTGRRGRLCCFLPLEDEINLPIIASGPVLTDPSRTHATVADPDTQRVITEVGRLVGHLLVQPQEAACLRLWELLIQGDDLRNVVLDGDSSIGAQVIAAAKETAHETGWPFGISEVALEPADVRLVFPEGAPAPLYEEASGSTARGLRTVFGMPTLRPNELAHRLDPTRVTDASRTRLARRLVEAARVEGRELTAPEQAVVGRAVGTAPASPLQTSAPATSGGPHSESHDAHAVPFSGAIARWRTAEVAVMEHLNQRGWQLTDVSRQNIGYDLDGHDDQAHAVHVEVKKVKSKDDRFSLTNNELSVMVSASTRYLLAIVIGDGASAQLALLDPLLDQIPRERVCRRWEWEYTDWSRFAQVVS